MIEENVGNRLTRREAIRAKCLDCCGGSIAEVRHCTLESCPLWRYRTGREVNKNVQESNK